jgi:hypothetical protein
LDHVYEETGDPFLRTPGQEQDEFLLASKLTGRQRQQSICNFKIA